MQVNQTHTFHKVAKKLHHNQKHDLDDAIKAIIADPAIGQSKVGDLAGVKVHKFKMVNQLTLLAYICDADTITLLALGSHENFYRDLKKSTH